MSDLYHKMNEEEAAKGLSKQSLGFDQYDAGNTIIQYKRERVRGHVLQYLPSNSSILELNAGTGEDATYFGRLGHRVHATDIAEGMQQALREKIVRQELTDRITTELCSFTTLEGLRNKGPSDLIFSNFAGLNCTGELDKVLHSFAPLVRPGGWVTLVILPPFSLWETAMLFRGNFKTAFRRPLSGRKGAPAHVEGVHFRCWYYPPSFVRGALKGSFEQIKLEGLCTIVPPSYIENFVEKHPVACNFLSSPQYKC